MGFETLMPDSFRRSEDPQLAGKALDENAQLTRRLLQGLPSNRDLLGQLIGGSNPVPMTAKHQ
jgi:hypothetical protein